MTLLNKVSNASLFVKFIFLTLLDLDLTSNRFFEPVDLNIGTFFQKKFSVLRITCKTFLKRYHSANSDGYLWYLILLEKQKKKQKD